MFAQENKTGRTEIKSGNRNKFARPAKPRKPRNDANKIKSYDVWCS